MSSSQDEEEHRRKRLLFVADRYLAVDDHAGARETIARILATDPDDVDALCTRSRVAIAERDWGTAVEAASRASALAPQNGWPYQLLAIARSGQGHHRAARRAAVTARELDPTDWQTHYLVAAVDLAKGWITCDTKASVREAVRLAPAEPAVHGIRGDLALAQGFLEEAEAAYRRGLSLDPESSELRTDLANTKLRGGRAAAAALAAMSVLADDPTTPQALQTLGLVRRHWTNLLLVWLGAALLPVFVVVTQTIPPEFDTTWIETPAFVVNPVFAALPLLFSVVTVTCAGRWARELRGRAGSFVRTVWRSDRGFPMTAGVVGLVIVGSAATAVLPYWMGPANLFFLCIIVAVARVGRPVFDFAQGLWRALL